MRSGARFVLVTDDIDFALADVFASARSNAPRWARVIDDPAEILALPESCKVHIAVWRSTYQQSGAEIAWRERRSLGDLVFLSDDEMDKIADWRARRATDGQPETSNAPVVAPVPQLPTIPIQQWT